MKKSLLMSVLAALLLLAPAVQAKDSLILNGSGLRTKMILGAMYDLSLMVPSALQGAEAPQLINSDQPMELVLTIKSKLINRKRFVHATSGGFAKAAKSGYESHETEAFLKQFDDTVFRRGDIIRMSYGSKGLTTAYQTQETAEDGAVTFKSEKLGTLAGLDLKKALFAIWLGEAPVQASLKKGLLGNP
jgi:Chalcone isomerase-like